MPDAILFTGHSGLRLEVALNKLAKAHRSSVVGVRTLCNQRDLVELYKADHRSRLDPEIRLMERKGGLQFLLKRPRDILNDLWRKGVARGLKEARRIAAAARTSRSTKYLLLSLHATYWHAERNEFLPLYDMHYLEDQLRANRISVELMVTLIDDVYHAHDRLSERDEIFWLKPEEKAELSPFELFLRTHAHLSRLLDWREDEILASDTIAKGLDVENVLMGMKHELNLVTKLFPVKKRGVRARTERYRLYLSHPIARAREFYAAGRRRAAAAFAKEVETLYAAVNQGEKLAVIAPTRIDEVRIEPRPAAGPLRPFLTPIWPLSGEEWPNRKHKELLYVRPRTPSRDTPFGISRAQWRGLRSTGKGDVSSKLEALSAKIYEQVGPRDRRLVDQCPGLFVYRPYFDGDTHTGVMEELVHFSDHLRFRTRGWERRWCFLYTPPEDLGKWRVRFLFETIRPAELAPRSKSSWSAEKLRRSEEQLRTNSNLVRSTGRGALNSEVLQDALEGQLGAVVFPAVERRLRKLGAVGPVPEPERRAQRDRAWRNLTKRLNDADPIDHWEKLSEVVTLLKSRLIVLTSADAEKVRESVEEQIQKST